MATTIYRCVYIHTRARLNLSKLVFPKKKNLCNCNHTTFSSAVQPKSPRTPPAARSRSDHVRHAPYVSNGAMAWKEVIRVYVVRAVNTATEQRSRAHQQTNKQRQRSGRLGRGWRRKTTTGGRGGEWNPRLYAWRRTPHLPCRPTAAAPPAVHSMHRHGARCAGGWLASPHLQSMHAWGRAPAPPGIINYY
jgi:hypothetical protein